MLLTIQHETRYSFDFGVNHGLQRLRLRPKSTHGQQIVEWTTDLQGATHEAAYDDQHQNHVELVSLDPGVREVVVTCHGTVRTADNNGVVGEHSGHFPLWCFLRATPLTRAGLKVRALVAGIDADRRDPLAFLHKMSEAVRGAVDYVPGTTDVKTSAEQALAAGRGVCQDQAHVFISAGRLVDIPTRYVGGYLKMDGRIEQDAGHGWAEAYVRGLGWVGFDVANAICPDERYVRVASGCDYSDAAPFTGIATGTGESRLSVHLSVEENRVGQQQQSQGGQHQSRGE
ncbi:transglutaminase-like putative cysteine protease [Novosphingobium chloroacetimidivorans]|uniref:Transglutaminase-like putative cysteine protease n=1 Tax=Novosphingobium chloroacetimidivorans TaxID=1428314 RepID=A0A7W7NVL7_9SPHN|nr:transglutaminase family protein [Novosphingobium chloroacetimidivorans]MBB4857240.1 transglutaminase-like putative cysteine protease [Novosphingobium chloroacetimidivorans]